MILRTAVLLAAVVSSLPAAAPPAAAAAPDAVAVTAPVRTMLAELHVAPESRDGYTRDAFRHWVDADRDGCPARAEVLLEEAMVPPITGARCALTGGRWYSYYDDRYVDGAHGLDVDHLVALAEAADSGAMAWTAERREAYANDLGAAVSLVAVTAASNRSKGDRDPAGWLPPVRAAHCRYLTDWIATKRRWALAVDAAERDAMVGLASRCPNVPITVTVVP